MFNGEALRAPTIAHPFDNGQYKVYCTSPLAFLFLGKVRFYRTRFLLSPFCNKGESVAAGDERGVKYLFKELFNSCGVLY